MNLFIADDHEMIIDGITAMFENDADVKIVGSATTTVGLVRQVIDSDADVLVLDIRFEGKGEVQEQDGIAILKELKSAHPDLPILMLTMHEGSAYVKACIDAGANGYLLKNTGKSIFKEALIYVQAGGVYLSNEASHLLVKHEEPTVNRGVIDISTRELEVISYICEELTTVEIADRMCIQPSTVKSHRKSIMTKLDVRNVAGIVRYALENDLV